MQRRISDIADDLLMMINQLPPENKTLNIYLALESKLSLVRFFNMVVKYRNTTEEATSVTLEPFKAFLAARWQCIKKTNAIYMHSPDTPINQICIQLANELARVLDIPFYHFLMPDLKHAELLAGSTLKEFILSDDDIPINVLTCLDSYKEEGRLLHLSGKPLSSAEVNRLISHSEEIRAYYLAILTNSPGEEIDACRKKCVANKEKYRINASYEKEGDQLLVKYICAGINRSGDLVSAMLNYIPKYKWHSFVKSMSNNDLFRIILDADEDAISDRLAVKSILTDKFMNVTATLAGDSASLVEKEKKIKAWLLCVIEVYQRARKSGDDYTSSSGYYLSFFPSSYTGVYSEEEKLEAADKLIDAMLNDANSLSTINSLLSVGTLHKYAHPLQSGVLGWLVTEIQKLGECLEGQERKHSLA